jgi:hypothetical protein
VLRRRLPQRSLTRDDARTADRNAVARLGNRQGEALNY